MVLDTLEALVRTEAAPNTFIPSSGNIGRGFHFTKKGPGRKHNHTGIESQLKVMESKEQHVLRNRLNRWPTRVAKFYARFGFCPVTVPVFVP